MAEFLDQPPGYYVADLLENYWGTVNPTVEGFVALFNSSDPLESTEFPISTNWPAGDTYPILTLTNTDPTVPGGGETNITSIQGNASGNNQRRLENILLTVHTDSTETYGTTDADEFAYRLYEHAFNIIDAHSSAPLADEIDAYYITPPEGSIPNQGSTEVTYQQQGTVTVNWEHTPQ